MIETLAKSLTDQGYDALTPVQQAVTTAELQQADLLVSAETGSGKTVGFGLAIAPTILGESGRFGPTKAPFALIIAPTRELAMQVSRELQWLYSHTGAVVTTCVGGMDARSERRALERGSHIVVATPGRLCDHIKRGNIDLSSLRAVVLDEADEMLDLGFREELEFILGEAPTDRRTLMFSATVPPAIERLAQSYQRDAERVVVRSAARQHADIEYRAMNVHPRDTENAILNVLRFYDAKNAIVFCNTRAAVARLTARLANRHFSVVALSGELTQSERVNALQALRDGRARVCVATDVAARGIDLPNLELVIHADLPSSPDTLLHRSGRTGRAGRKGVSALIVPPKFRSKANRLLGSAKLKAEWGPAPSAEDVYKADDARLLSHDALSAPASDDASDVIAALVSQYSADQLAAAFVNLYRTHASAPEELTDPGAKDDTPRQSFGPSVWYALSIGRNDGAEPRTLLPMLCRMGDLSRDDIGAIRTQPRHSHVEILATSADRFEKALGPEMQADPGITVTRLDTAPEATQRPDRKAREKRKGPPSPSATHAKEQIPKPTTAPKQGNKDARPPKSHKTERSPMKAGAAPKPKSSGKAKPVWNKETVETPERKQKAKAVWKDPAKPVGKKKPAQRKSGQDGEKPYKRAADPSKRFTPPHKIGKQNGKPKAGAKARGGDARPRRGKAG